MFNPLKTTALAITALCLFGGSANADTLREVKCANGKTVQASGTQSNRQACLTIASQPGAAGDLTAAGNTQQIGLLLPAVQSAREAARRLDEK